MGAAEEGEDTAAAGDTVEAGIAAATRAATPVGLTRAATITEGMFTEETATTIMEVE